MLSFQEKEGSHTITNLLFYLCCSTGQRVLWTYVQACKHLEDGFSLQRLSEAQPPSHQVLDKQILQMLLGCALAEAVWQCCIAFLYEPNQSDQTQTPSQWSP